eukprot:SAG11_NODE_1689_length_4443_cov_7.468002_5_plen_40_part_00
MKVLELLRNELAISLQLCGCASVAELTANHLYQREVSML